MSHGSAAQSSSHDDDTSLTGQNPSVAPDQMLPPVEPPDAGFILKLFIIPAIIVTIVVGVVMVFNQLAHMGSNPTAYVEDIERGAQNSWQRAHDLTHELRTNAEARQDPKLANRLARLLERMMEEPVNGGAGAEDKERIRVFLCKALGEFEIADGLPTLIAAAQPRTGSAASSDHELEIRRAALEAIAVRVNNMRNADIEVDESEVLPVLLTATESGENNYVRYTGTFGLGVFGGDEALDRLKVLLDDVDPSTRYNAATGLARYGEAACVPVLAEMLDPEETAHLKQFTSSDPKLNQTEKEQSLQFSQAQIVKNALRAAKILATSNSQADLNPLIQQIDVLLQRDVFPGAQTEIRDTKRTLEAQATKAS